MITAYTLHPSVGLSVGDIHLSAGGSDFPSWQSASVATAAAAAAAASASAAEIVQHRRRSRVSL